MGSQLNWVMRVSGEFLSIGSSYSKTWEPTLIHKDWNCNISSGQIQKKKCGCEQWTWPSSGEFSNGKFLSYIYLFYLEHR